MTPLPPPQRDERPPRIQFTHSPSDWTLTIRTRARQVSFRRTIMGWVIADLVLLAGWMLQAVRATPTHPFDGASALVSFACTAFVQVMSIRTVYQLRATAPRQDAEPPESAPTA